MRAKRESLAILTFTKPPLLFLKHILSSCENIFLENKTDLISSFWPNALKTHKNAALSRFGCKVVA